MRWKAAQALRAARQGLTWLALNDRRVAAHKARSPAITFRLLLRLRPVSRLSARCAATFLRHRLAFRLSRRLRLVLEQFFLHFHYILHATRGAGKTKNSLIDVH